MDWGPKHRRLTSYITGWTMEDMYHNLLSLLPTSFMTESTDILETMFKGYFWLIAFGSLVSVLKVVQ